MVPIPRRAFLSTSAGALLATVAPGGAALAGTRKGRSDALTAALQPFVDNRQISGGVGLVSVRGTWHVAAVGQSDITTHRPMRDDDLFWIASMTKPMTAVAVLMLQDAGRLSIEDAVEKHLPAFKGQWMLSERLNGRRGLAPGDKNPQEKTVLWSELSNDQRVLAPAPRPITIRDLLTHTSGMGEIPVPQPDSSLAEIVTGAAREPLQFPPGTRWSYCNSGINTLGRIVEVVGGQPFAAFLDSRVFRPLGMRDTSFWPTPGQARRLAKSYKVGSGGALEEVPVFFLNGELSDRRRPALGAGGLYSTAPDVARFYEMMLAGGRAGSRRLLSEAAVRQMTTTQTGEIKTGFVEGMSWGLGFQVVKDPQGVTAMLSRGTYGHGGAYATQSWADPVRGLAMVLMIQRSGLPNGDASEMRRALQEAAVRLG